MHRNQYCTKGEGGWATDGEWETQQGTRVYRMTQVITPEEMFVEMPPDAGDQHPIYDGLGRSNRLMRSITIQTPGFSGGREMLKKKA